MVRQSPKREAGDGGKEAGEMGSLEENQADSRRVSDCLGGVPIEIPKGRRGSGGGEKHVALSGGRQGWLHAVPGMGMTTEGGHVEMNVLIGHNGEGGGFPGFPSGNTQEKGCFSRKQGGEEVDFRAFREEKPHKREPIKGGQGKDCFPPIPWI